MPITKRRAFSFGAFVQTTRKLYDKYLNNPGPSMDEIAEVWDECNDNPDKAKRSVGNLFAHDEGIDDEYYINEIIGIDDERYIKEKEDKKKREAADEIPF